MKIPKGTKGQTTIDKPKYFTKKSLKIPKGPSESVYRRRTDNKMGNKKVQKDKQRSTKHTHKNMHAKMSLD